MKVKVKVKVNAPIEFLNIDIVYLAARTKSLSQIVFKIFVLLCINNVEFKMATKNYNTADRQTEHILNAHFYAAYICKVLGQLNENLGVLETGTFLGHHFRSRALRSYSMHYYVTWNKTPKNVNFFKISHSLWPFARPQGVPFWFFVFWKVSLDFKSNQNKISFDLFTVSAKILVLLSNSFIKTKYSVKISILPTKQSCISVYLVCNLRLYLSCKSLGDWCHCHLRDLIYFFIATVFEYLK